MEKGLSMKICKVCGKEYDGAIEKCEICGAELIEPEASEEKNEIIDVPQNEVVVLEEGTTESEELENQYCVYCGGRIEPEKHYCVRCGKSSVTEGLRHCTQCGAELGEHQKFCGKCGHKAANVIMPKELDSITGRAKKVNSKKMIIGIAVIVALIALIMIGKSVVPKLFVTPEEYMAQGNYEKAYEKADEKEKESVLVENLIAQICSTAKSDLKDPESFKLRDGWYDKKEKRIVIQIQGTNSYGGQNTSYTYSSTDKEYQLYTTIQDFDEEEYYSWDDIDDKIEKALENVAKDNVKELIGKSENHLNKELIERINGLKDADLLDNIELLEETKQLLGASKEV